MSQEFTFAENGVINSGYRQIGYITENVIFAGGSGGPWGGQQVGYIQNDVIFAGGSGGPWGGTQVGYVQGDDLYAGGSGGPWGGKLVGKVTFPHPRWNAAAYFLLT